MNLINQSVLHIISGGIDQAIDKYFLYVGPYPTTIEQVQSKSLEIPYAQFQLFILPESAITYADNADVSTSVNV